MNSWQTPTPEQSECVAMACLSKSRYEKEIGHRADRLHVSQDFAARFQCESPFMVSLEIQGMPCELDGRLLGVACYTRRA